MNPRSEWRSRGFLRGCGLLIGELEAHRQPRKNSLHEHQKDGPDTAAIESERDILIGELAIEETVMAEEGAALQPTRKGIRAICEETGKTTITRGQHRAILRTGPNGEAASRQIP
jgi:hypothetical protein